MRPAADLDDRALGVEVVVDLVRVGDEVALVAGEEIVDRFAAWRRVYSNSTCLSGTTATQKWPLGTLLACTSTPVASTQRYGCRERILSHRSTTGRASSASCACQPQIVDLASSSPSRA